MLLWKGKTEYVPLLAMGNTFISLFMTKTNEERLLDKKGQWRHIVQVMKKKHIVNSGQHYVVEMWISKLFF